MLARPARLSLRRFPSVAPRPPKRPYPRRACPEKRPPPPFFVGASASPSPPYTYREKPRAPATRPATHPLAAASMIHLTLGATYGTTHTDMDTPPPPSPPIRHQSPLETIIDLSSRALSRCPSRPARPPGLHDLLSMPGNGRTMQSIAETVNYSMAPESAP